MTSDNSEKLCQISDRFKQLHYFLDRAEAQVREAFRSKESERERAILKYLSSIEEAQQAKLYAEKNISDNDLQISIVRDCEKKIAKFTADKLKAKGLTLDVNWSDLGFEALALKISSIVAMPSDTKLPDLACPMCSGGVISNRSEKGKLVLPNHLAIEEETNNIYISDWKGGCIQIFDKNAGFLRLFRHIFSNPRAILIKNSKLCVIENNKEEKFIRFKIFSVRDDKQLFISNSQFGSGRGEFGIASSFDITPDGRWYISEPDNHRVQIMNANLTHHSFFSPCSGFSFPIQIRIKEAVYVLDNDKCCRIFILSLEGGILLNLIELSGVLNAMYFALLAPHWLVVSDYNEDCLKITDFEGKVLYSGERLTKPKGVEVLRNGSVVSVSMNERGYCLNIY